MKKVETAENTSRTEDGNPEAGILENRGLDEMGKPFQIEPDLDFIQSLTLQAGMNFKQCFQCGTCSAKCTISPDKNPFPRKEMAWAGWGMKDKLLTDPDVWLCHQCNDCSTNCPRGARPGDLMAAIRKESIIQNSAPRFLARWVNQPRYLPLLLGLPAALLGTAIYYREPVENALGFGLKTSGEKVFFSYSSMIPQWLIMLFFGLFSVLAMLAMVIGVVRFWKALNSSREKQEAANGFGSSVLSVLKSVLLHDNFAACTTARPRFIAHLGILFGFLALSLVTIWVMTARINPLLSEFVYPFNFWNPWRVLANLGGLALLAGCIWLIRDRLEKEEETGKSTYFDWAFLGALFIVVLTGFITEIFHYLRLVPHRHVVYFVHLVFVFSLLVYLPYSKFAHMFYRTTAMVFAEFTGREWGAKQTKVVGALEE